MSFPIHPLDKALGDITSIRRQVARTTEFRGYGAATLAATGLFAILAAILQSFLLPDPANHIANYLRIWITTAILSAVLIGMQTLTRTRRILIEAARDLQNGKPTRCLGGDVSYFDLYGRQAAYPSGRASTYW